MYIGACYECRGQNKIQNEEVFCIMNTQTEVLYAIKKTYHGRKQVRIVIADN